MTHKPIGLKQRFLLCWLSATIPAAVLAHPAYLLTGTPWGCVALGISLGVVMSLITNELIDRRQRRIDLARFEARMAAAERQLLMAFRRR